MQKLGTTGPSTEGCPPCQGLKPVLERVWKTPGRPAAPERFSANPPPARATLVLSMPRMQAGPCALVTGGSRGIGLAIARRLTAAGHDLALIARDETRLAAAAKDLGPRATHFAVDVGGGAAATECLLAWLQAWLGTRPLDVLVNNAGVAPSERVETTSDAVLRTVLDLHVEVPFRLIRALLPGMRARGRGTIVQLGSTAGLRGFPFTAAYAAAKHGMVGMTRALIAELGDSPLRVHAVCPGFVDTDITRGAAAKIAARGKQSAEDALGKLGKMNALGRMHTPDEVAGFVATLVAQATPSGVWDLDREPPTRIE